MRDLLQVVPYYSQWESECLAGDIIEGCCTPADDQLWANSGAVSVEEYAAWANHICGMACLKMILAAWTDLSYGTVTLARIALEYGAYQLVGGSIRGLIYAPFIEMIRNEFGIDAEVVTGASAEDVGELVCDGAFFIASVHPSIRSPQQPPPQKGGHLVLITRSDAHGVWFHNPSGHEEEARRDVCLNWHTFDQFFAGRGIRVLPIGSAPIGL